MLIWTSALLITENDDPAEKETANGAVKCKDTPESVSGKECGAK